MLATQMCNVPCRSTFANPKYLKKAQSDKPRLYAIPYDTSDPANRFCPDGEETITLEKESRSKLDKDTVKPYNYTYQNSLYETFKPPSKTYLDQLERAKELRKTNGRKSIKFPLDPIVPNVSHRPLRLSGNLYNSSYSLFTSGSQSTMDGHPQAVGQFKPRHHVQMCLLKITPSGRHHNRSGTEAESQEPTEMNVKFKAVSKKLFLKQSRQATSTDKRTIQVDTNVFHNEDGNLLESHQQASLVATEAADNDNETENNEVTIIKSNTNQKGKKKTMDRKRKIQKVGGKKTSKARKRLKMIEDVEQ
ncbi:hypothetical protein Tco_0930513 [Tanacetum coccineum]